jgi:hypothetical protein
MDIPESISTRLRWTREALGHSQAEWCRLTNIGPQAWNNYERGLRRIDAKTFNAEIPESAGHKARSPSTTKPLYRAKLAMPSRHRHPQGDFSACCHYYDYALPRVALSYEGM